MPGRLIEPPNNIEIISFLAFPDVGSDPIPSESLRGHTPTYPRGGIAHHGACLGAGPGFSGGPVVWLCALHESGL